MLDKAVAATRADKLKALDMFNSGEVLRAVPNSTTDAIWCLASRMVGEPSDP